MNREKPKAIKKKGEIEDIKLFGDHDDRSVKIRKKLPSNFNLKLIELLQEYYEFFAWFAIDMPRIDIEIAFHKLAIDPSVKLV